MADPAEPTVLDKLKARGDELSKDLRDSQRAGADATEKLAHLQALLRDLGDADKQQRDAVDDANKRYAAAQTALKDYETKDEYKAAATAATLSEAQANAVKPIIDPYVALEEALNDPAKGAAPALVNANADLASKRLKAAKSKIDLDDKRAPVTAVMAVLEAIVNDAQAAARAAGAAKADPGTAYWHKTRADKLLARARALVTSKAVETALTAFQTAATAYANDIQAVADADGAIPDKKHAADDAKAKLDESAAALPGKVKDALKAVPAQPPPPAPQAAEETAKTSKSKAGGNKPAPETAKTDT